MRMRVRLRWRDLRTTVLMMIIMIVMVTMIRNVPSSVDIALDPHLVIFDVRWWCKSSRMMTMMSPGIGSSSTARYGVIVVRR